MDNLSTDEIYRKTGMSPIIGKCALGPSADQWAKMSGAVNINFKNTMNGEEEIDKEEEVFPKSIIANKDLTDLPVIDDKVRDLNHLPNEGVSIFKL